MANALRDNQTRALGFSNAPVFDRRDLGTVGRGTADAYLSSIMAAPEWLLSKMLRDDPYQKGVLQSGPQDRLKGEQLAWERHMADQAQNRDYAQGQDYGTGLGLVADPFIDALGAIPAVGKALKLQKGAKAKPINALSDLFRDEAGVIRAYHGTPHEVDKFRMANIGTGEGAAAYGHGLYFAENPKVAKEYQKGLSEGTFFKKDGSVFDERESLKNINVRATLDRSDGDIDKAISKGEYVIKQIPNTQGAELAKADIETLKGLKEQGGINRSSGATYEVDLDVNPEDLLDWDKALTEQPKKIQKSLREMGYGEDSNTMTGAEIHEDLQWFYGNDKEKAASELNKSGIGGIRYYNQGARTIGGEGAAEHNVVMFNENLINILGKD